jgi:hypothetical protein
MSEVPRQLLITLVHGTWPYGPRIVRFIWRVLDILRRKRREPLICWFEEGSPFLTRVCAELSDIPHKITPLLWSGENSIFVRDERAHALAEHLAAEHTEHPQATQLVIAHSHGGNIALRALYHLQKRDASHLSGADKSNPLVVTLATPFVEVHHADLGRSPHNIRVAVVGAILLPLLTLANAIFPFGDSNWIFLHILIIFAIFYSAVAFIASNWLSEKGDARRQNQVDRLVDATRLGEIVAPQAQRLLIIRAIDDEASLLMALGTISSYVTSKAIKLVFRTGWMIFLIIVIVAIFITVLKGKETEASKVVWSALILILLGLYSATRTAHGRELARSPMECQVSTHSTPDAIGPSKIVTLVRRTFVQSLRHGIYDHEDCPKTISDWVHSQLRPGV